MIPTGSRYESAEHQFTLAHSYNEWGYPILEGQNPNLKVKLTNRDTTYRQEGFGALSQAQEYYAKDTENVQFLAYKFLGDAKRWWEVATANVEIWYPLDIRAGTYMRVPSQ